MNNLFIPSREESNNFYSRKLSPMSKNTTDSRPFTRVQSVTAVRKKPWNRRFIYNKIPDYYQIRDKNIMLKKPRMNNMQKNNVFDTNYITYQQSKMNSIRKKKFSKGFNRTTSGFFSHSSYVTNNNEFSLNNRNIISPLTNSALNRNNYVRERLNLNVNSNDENFNSIKKLWNELCVFMSYREVFIIIYNQLSGIEKEQFYQKELNELNSVKNDIKSLNYYIEQRTNILKDLYEKNIKLNQIKNSDDVINEILTDISNLIEKLREATIDVCYAMRKLKNDMYIVNNIAKYDIDLLSTKSKFDKNYLIKMKGELSFLKEGNAKFFFNINDDRSPFLLKASDPIANNDKEMLMRIIPLKDEIKDHIKECNYYIYQELIAYQQNIIAKEKIFRCVSPIKSNNRHMMTNNSFMNMNKEVDISKNNFLGGGTLNESVGFRKMNKNIFSDRPSDINSVLSTNEFMKKKIDMRGIPPNINRPIPRPNKDLFSQKLLWGFMPGDWGQEILAEDEKNKDEKEEDKSNEEEEEEEEKSEDDTTRNELNELIEEKKSELDGNESSYKSKINFKKISEENKNKSQENIEKENQEQKINTNINKNSSRTKLEMNNKNIEENNINLNNKNEDINKYLNSKIPEQKSTSSNPKNNNQTDNERILSNNPINTYNNSFEKKEEKIDSFKSDTSKINSVNNNKKEENKIDNIDINIDEKKEKENNIENKK